MEAFEDFTRIVRKSVELDPWVRERGIKGYLEDLKKEAEEALEAKDTDEMKDELGDVFYDLLHICQLAEEQGLFCADEVIKAAKSKLERRKPYLKENRKVTKEDAVRIWMRVKEEERMKKPKLEEFVYYVDENDNILGRVSRRDCVLRNLWHRGTGILVENSKGEILIHKRSESKDRFPGYYDIFFGGHVAWDESYDDNAKRELLEEAGIDKSPVFLFHDRFESEKTKAHTNVYMVKSDGPFRLQKEEVEKAFFVSISKLNEMIKTEKFTPDGVAGFRRYLEMKDKRAKTPQKTRK